MKNKLWFKGLSCSLAMIFAFTVGLAWSQPMVRAGETSSQSQHKEKQHDSPMKSKQKDQKKYRKHEQSATGEPTGESMNKSGQRDLQNQQSLERSQQQRIRMILSTSKLIGATVYTTKHDQQTQKQAQQPNQQAQELGKIDSLMVDPETGRVAFAVISHGGFLGFGSEKFAIPIQTLRIDRQNKRLVTGVSTSELKNAPEFNEEKFAQWDEAGNHSDYVERLYRHYNVSAQQSVQKSTADTRNLEG